MYRNLVVELSNKITLVTKGCKIEINMIVWRLCLQTLIFRARERVTVLSYYCCHKS